MLIDWLTLVVPYSVLNAVQLHAVTGVTDRIRRYCPRTGEVRWESGAWESVRSDSHQLAMQAGSDCLRIQGSPARCMGTGDTVFGGRSAMDIRVCARAMLVAAGDALGVSLGVALGVVKVTRIDVTGNLLLESLAQVRQALEYLRSVEGGRYRVSQTAGDTVYWNHRSRLHSDKAYAKGPHLAYLLKSPSYTGRKYSPAELLRADRLLRLEHTMRSQFLRERAQVSWYNMTPDYLMEQWRSRFEKMIGDVELVAEGDVKARILAAAKTDGQGRAVFGTWCMIQSQGWQFTRDHMARASWYRHLKILHSAGLGDLDISRGQVAAIRRHNLILSPVLSWDQLLAA